MKYSLDRVLDPKTSAPLVSYLGPVAQVQAADKYTVRIAMKEPFAPLVNVLADRRPGSIVDREVVEKNGNLQNLEGGSGPFLTRLVARFAAGGRLEAHIDALRANYAAKCELMAAALRRELPDAHFVEPDGGFFIWLRLPEGVGAAALAPVALRHGVEFLAGARCFADGGGDDYIRLAFSEEPARRPDQDPPAPSTRCTYCWVSA